METLRTALWGVVLLLVYLLWSAWQQEQAIAKPQPVSTASAPITAMIPAPTKVDIIAPEFKTRANTTVNAENIIYFSTDVFTGAIDLAGGQLVQLSLHHYAQETNQNASTHPFILLNQTPNKHYVAQTGWIEPKSSQQKTLRYDSEHTRYVLSPDQHELHITLTGKNKHLIFTKHFILKRGDYQIEVHHQVHNTTQTPWQGQLYAQLQRNEPEQKSSSIFSLPTYTGGARSSDHKAYEKTPFTEFATHPLQQKTQTGWIAFVERYFLSAWIPIDTQDITLYSHAQDKVYTLGMLGAQRHLLPNEQLNVAVKLYAGPAVMDQLRTAAPHLDLTVDYGILWFISTGLFWLMKQLYLWTCNWGWSIILVTLLIKLAFYGLSAKSFRSMAAMRKLQPRLQALKERYGDDRQKIAQATMELYRKERINPLGGCLPTVIQLPVFIALYWVLLESVELRQAPFIFWIQDLSSKDPLYILPILMGISAFIQQKLTPAPADPTQAKVMLLFPILMTVIFLNFPAGLVLYWFSNNTLSLLQQTWMLKRFK